MSSRLISLSGCRPESCELIAQRERRAGLCALCDDQRGDTRGEVADVDDDVVIGSGRVLQRIDTCQRDGVVVEAVETLPA
jgi:hypothetical protein